jgi:hypothetical protein
MKKKTLKITLKITHVARFATLPILKEQEGNIFAIM